MTLRSSIAVFAALAVGCASDPPARIELAPNGTEFQLVTTTVGPVATIPWTITNTGKRTVFLAGCPTVNADRFVDGQWVPDETPVYCMLQNSTLGELHPGDRLDANAWVSQAGTYRLRTTFTTDVGSAGAARTATSTTFAVR